MPLPIPKNLVWPDSGDFEGPEVKCRPLVNPKDPFWTQFWDWLRKRSRWIVTEDYFTYCEMLNAWIFIPTNFVYDFASIPRVPFGLFLRPEGILAYGAGPHDFGSLFGGLMLSPGPGHDYEFVKLSQRTIDNIFYDLNKKTSSLSFINSAAHWAVVTFGSPDLVNIELADWSKPVGRYEWGI